MSRIARSLLALGTLALVVGATAASVSPVQGKKALAGTPYRDTRWGFEVTAFDKWAAIPPQPDARYEVGIFNAPEPIYEPKTGVPYLPELRIYRFDPKGASAAPMQQGKSPTGDDGPKTGDDDGADFEKEMDKLALRNVDEYLANRTGAQRQGKAEKVKFGKLEGTVNLYLAVTRTKVKYQHYTVAFNAPDGAQILLDYEMPDFAYDDWKDLFVASAKTFKFIEKTAVDANRLDGLTPIERDRILHKEDVARTPGWKFAETPHFFIKYNVEKPDFIKELKERIEAIRKVFVDRFGDREMTELPVCRITKTMDEYYKYGGPGGSGGFWNQETKELVLPCLKEYDIKWTWAVMNHEAFHQFIYYYYGKVAPHSWYNEGTGDYYAGFKYLGNGKFEIKPLGPSLPLIDRASTIKEAVKKGDHVPLEKIFRFTQQDYYAKPDVCYAEGWSIVYFLMEGKKLGVKPWRAEWDRILPEYLDVLLKTKDTNKAVESALKDLKGDKMQELEETWKSFVLKMPK